MEGKDKILVYAITAACIVGIIIVGALMVFTKTPEPGFSELYFEDSDMLPRSINLGSSINFTFTVVSHEKGNVTYDYIVTYDREPIASGSFYLMPDDPNAAGINADNKKTIGVNITPEVSSLIKMDQATTGAQPETVSQMNFNSAIGSAVSQGDRFNRVDVVTSPMGYSVISSNGNNTISSIDVKTGDKIILPMTIQTSGNDDISLTIFDPKKKESMNSSRTNCSMVGNPSTAIPQENSSVSDYGYDITREEWIGMNNYGNVDIKHIISNAKYRYAFKKIYVKVVTAGQTVNSEGTKYEIHFWVIVGEKPETLEKLGIPIP